MQAKDEVGNRYGHWVVIARAENGPARNARWSCHCDCGTEREVLGFELRNGNSGSCGCRNGLPRAQPAPPRPLRWFYPPYHIGKGQAAFNALFSVLLCKARGRGYKWALTRQQMYTLTKQNCHYCGVEPRQVKRVKESIYIYNGIDRKNNELGYIPENCVPCCGDCNRAKRMRTFEEYKAWIHRSHEYLAGI